MVPVTARILPLWFQQQHTAEIPVSNKIGTAKYVFNCNFYFKRKLWEICLIDFFGGLHFVVSEPKKVVKTKAMVDEPFIWKCY